MRRAPLTDDRRLQDMIDATPCAVIDFAIDEAVKTAERRAAAATRRDRTDKEKSRAADHPKTTPLGWHAGERGCQEYRGSAG